MSAQIIVLADHRSDRLETDSLGPSSDCPLAGVVEEGLLADPYGLVAAVRALAANMEQMRGRSVAPQKTSEPPADGARTTAAAAGTVAPAIDGLDGIDTFLVCV
jgi:hypothetical protein